MSAAWRILVVDDDAVFADTLACALGRRGHEVVVANTGEEALADSTRPFHAAILDLRLGTDSGLRLIPFLKALHPGIRILLLTG